ncbi:TetR/AcrR family transcriptional regulator [Homoserinimonas sp. A447]
MTRPRFHKLPARQQAAILDAALAEFAAHGYSDASLNRIIEAAGISKGSMYYYFDDKQDLYAHVIRVQLEALLQRVGPLPVPDTQHPDEFWATLLDYYLRLMRMLTASPEAASLLRDWLTGPGTPPLRDAKHDAEQEMLPWLTQTVVAGQRIGAVRTDVPVELILAVTMGMGQAIDTWLITQTLGDTQLEQAARTLIDMMRRALTSQ